MTGAQGFSGQHNDSLVTAIQGAGSPTLGQSQPPSHPFTGPRPNESNLTFAMGLVGEENGWVIAFPDDALQEITVVSRKNS